MALDSVVSDMFGKSATAITDYLTSDEDFDPQHCVSIIQRSLKKKADDVLASIEGYGIEVSQRAIIAIVRMILTAIYSMLSTGGIWNPVDLFKVDMPEHLKEQQHQKAVKQAVYFLVKVS